MSAIVPATTPGGKRHALPWLLATASLLGNAYQATRPAPEPPAPTTAIVQPAPQPTPEPKPEPMRVP